MEQATCSFRTGQVYLRSLPICLSLFCGPLMLVGSSSTFRINMLKISTMMVVMSAPFNPSPMHLPSPPLAILYYTLLYLTRHAVTKVTRSVKYKHAPSRWHGKKSLSMDWL